MTDDENLLNLSIPEEEPPHPLKEALGSGDPDQVRELIAAGADIHYKRPKGYDALIDAVHSHDVFGNPRLLEMLSLLVEHRVNLAGVSDYGESGLRVLSRYGRFDAVGFLLKSGADRSQLGWTPLMEVVCLGTVSNVKAALAAKPNLEARDWWERTAWLIALLTGDVDKAELLREAGADMNAVGRCGAPPIFYGVKSRSREMVLWLIQLGVDVHQTDEFGTTALIEAVQNEDRESVEILLAAGADVDVRCHENSALSMTDSKPMALRLLEAGADIAELSKEGRRALVGLPPSDESFLAALWTKNFYRSHTRSFGRTNPEHMRVPFWEAMILSGAYSYAARRRFEEAGEQPNEPVWCADRFGQSLTLLPDGRAVQIGGEHEDFYDPDFCIYNDVFILEPDGTFAIYGYPESDFPPTDFHTATLIGDHIYVIGSLGYLGRRYYSEPAVYRLDLRNCRIERVKTLGEIPGWIYKHRAAAVDSNAIRIWGGKIAALSEGGESHTDNSDVFILDLDELRWRREPPSI